VIHRISNPASNRAMRTVAETGATAGCRVLPRKDIPP